MAWRGVARRGGVFGAGLRHKPSDASVAGPVRGFSDRVCGGQGGGRGVDIEGHDGEGGQPRQTGGKAAPGPRLGHGWAVLAPPASPRASAAGPGPVWALAQADQRNMCFMGRASIPAGRVGREAHRTQARLAGQAASCNCATPFIRLRALAPRGRQSSTARHPLWNQIRPNSTGIISRRLPDASSRLPDRRGRG